MKNNNIAKISGVLLFVLFFLNTGIVRAEDDVDVATTSNINIEEVEIKDLDIVDKSTSTSTESDIEKIVDDDLLDVNSDYETASGTTSASSAKSQTLEIEADLSLPATSSLEEDKSVSMPIVRTSIIRDSLFDQTTILTSWAMLDMFEDKNILAIDDSDDEGVQILPSGKYNLSKNYSQCVIIADTKGASHQVKAVFKYPENVAYSLDNEDRGCARIQKQVQLSLVDQADAKKILCNSLRVNNNNLLTWNKNKKEAYSYGFDQVCASDGLLSANRAIMYCATSTLAYDDPAGDYTVEIIATNKKGDSDSMETKIKYMELTNMENDFVDLQYGMVRAGEYKYLLGDLSWGESNNPTLRNTGNTRLKIKIWQNDFNLGKTNDRWNVKYKIRAGDSPYLEYFPLETNVLDKVFELGSSVNLDLAIFINNFPKNEDALIFSGEMLLTAQKEPELQCSE